MQQEQSGETVGRKHKERSDKGRRHAIRGRTEEDEDEGPSRKRTRATPKCQSKRLIRSSSGKHKARAIISSEEENEEEEGEESDEEEIDMEEEFDDD